MSLTRWGGATLGLAALLAASWAHADELSAATSPEAAAAAPAQPPPAPANLPASDGKPRLTLHAYEEDAGIPIAQSFEAAAGERLAGDARLHYQPLADLLEPSEFALRALGEADLAVADAEKAFAEMDLDHAKKLLKQAILTYQRYLPLLQARGGNIEPLRDAWIKLAKTRFFDGNADGAGDALRYVFVLDPTVTFNPKQFPPQMKKAVVEAKLLFETLGTGKLTVDSDPPGAVAWLNGVRLAKPTPSEPVDAPAGPNLISYQRRGYAPSSAIFENGGGGEAAHALQSLSRYPGNPLGPLDRARLSLDASDTPPHLKGAAQALGVELILLVRFERSGAHTRITAYLYDARPDRILKRTTRVAGDGEVDVAAKTLAVEALLGVRLDGASQPPHPARGPGWFARFSDKTKTDFTRFYKWKYFWYVVGGVAGAAVIGSAVGGGVAAQQHQRSVNNAVVLFGGQ